jgi:SAM-dependent methyltransferase
VKQKDIFLESEGDAWLERNRDRLGVHDPVSDVIAESGIRPLRVLEVGCADGWRLERLRDRYGCEIMGVEPSRQACIEAAQRRVPAVQSTASVLAVSPSFDLVIYGFCLYLTEPSDWLRIAAEGDSVLQAGGRLIIHDFVETRPFARRYEHHHGVLAYHIDFPKLWLAHPLYSLVSRTIYDNGEMVTVMKKNSASVIEVLP